MSAIDSPAPGGVTAKADPSKEPTLTKDEAQAIVQEKEAVLQKEVEHQKRLQEAQHVLQEHRKRLRKEDPQISSADSKIIKYASGAAAAAAVVPVPGLDLAAVAGVQVKMLSDLAKVFNVPLSQDMGKAAISTLIGSFGMGTVMTGTAYSMLKFIPLIGNVAGLLALPTIAFGATYALGKVFSAHFASGGNLLNLDPVAAKSAFQGYFEEGKGLAPAGARATTKR